VARAELKEAVKDTSTIARRGEGLVVGAGLGAEGLQGGGVALVDVGAFRVVREVAEDVAGWRRSTAAGDMLNTSPAWRLESTHRASSLQQSTVSGSALVSGSSASPALLHGGATAGPIWVRPAVGEVHRPVQRWRVRRPGRQGSWS
jgi:hypothetical protein